MSITAYNVEKFAQSSLTFFHHITVEDLIALIEAVAQSLAQGDVGIDLFNKMFSHVSLYGPQLEIYSKEILDRSFIAFRNASQDDRLKISVRLNLLNLIELRANSWQISDGLSSYYKQKAANSVEVRWIYLMKLCMH